ncbi:MAG TPA: type II toxin-antitoxin system RelE/ParE family toxin [Pirellulaceae bacterium]|nr:type II toxin-antitoxin system RelE/ParE family toxin [Planctomycetales bacterium]MCB9941104.1 type II toxin-antitoxin system RelE/ParE family toxin [Planctomycetaceae bacterium]HRX82002.1 type II toxin-antitoxin system RelE/ParE family toxin [Pirellulaceae bacterium]
MIEFHELALAEARQAQGWYADRSERVALRFRGQLDDAIARVAASPERFPKLSEGIQYIVVFCRRDDSNLLVLAIAHTSQGSGYWADRA